MRGELPTGRQNSNTLIFVEGGGTAHSAAGSALGYLYQSYLPLLELARRAPESANLVVRLEFLDDVEFENGYGSRELLQSKHHLSETATLTDMGTDIWRSINAWISAIETIEAGEVPSLTLVTTATAPAGSAASWLRGDVNRDPSRALEILRSAAHTSVNALTQPWRNRFSALPRARQERIVAAIVVADGTVSIDGLDEELEKALFWGAPVEDEHREDFIEHIKGWWLGVAVALLTGGLEAFSATDMIREIADIRDQYGPENLPTDPELPDPDAAEIGEYEERVFIKQLLLIAATDRQLANAIRDCYRAFTQRSRWQRRDLIGVGEIDRFERRLVEEWNHLFTNLTAELKEGASDDDRKRCGREIFNQASTNAQARIRQKYEEPFMTRGSLHLLADDRRVGWHPEFEARLQELLEPVVQGA